MAVRSFQRAFSDRVLSRTTFTSWRTISALRSTCSVPVYRSANTLQTHRNYSDKAPKFGATRLFDLKDRVFVVTGGAQGLGLALAEGLAEVGGHVYCLDRQSDPPDEFNGAKSGLEQKSGVTLTYKRVDVTDVETLNATVSDIADQHKRLDGLVAAAGMQHKLTPALDYTPDMVAEMMNVNFGGVYQSAVACARQMIKHKTTGSMVLIGSMSGLIANKGCTSSVYNPSKGAVIQLGRNLAMEWGKIVDGKPIRVNVLCPGTILTAMSKRAIADDPPLGEMWNRETFIGRIAEPHEFRGPAIFLLSDASSFVTGSHMLVDGGYTAW